MRAVQQEERNVEMTPSFLRGFLRGGTSNENWGEQDGGGVGERGVHLSPWIHQEYTFRHTEMYTERQLRADRST